MPILHLSSLERTAAVLGAVTILNMSAGECQTSNRNEYDDKDDEKNPLLDEGDIQLLKTYGTGPYTHSIKATEDDIKKYQDKVKELIGIKESDTGLSDSSQWDLTADKQALQEEQPFQLHDAHKNNQSKHR